MKSIYIKIKEKGLIGTLKTVRNRVFFFVNIVLFNLFTILPVNSRMIVFESEGDLCDNAYAFYHYLNDNDFFEEYTAIWLVENEKNYNDTNIIKYVNKNRNCLSLRRSYYIAISKYIIYDHNNPLWFLRKRKKQIIVNLFHGCTFKAKKGGITKISNMESMMPVTSQFWIPIMADFMMCDIDKVKPVGYPRNDYFFEEKSESLERWIRSIKRKEYSKVIMWMPTFRKSNVNSLSENYYGGATGLPLLETRDDILQFNSLLNDLNILLIVKIHHLQLEYPTFKERFSNILILDDVELAKFNVQLYQIVSQMDALITDYSSISNDFLLLNRPMIFTLDDYQEYKNSRGLSREDAIIYYPGHHVYNLAQFYDAIQDIYNGVDKYKHEREDLIPVMHEYQDGESSKRIAHVIGLI